jgi:hypothetical protein
MDDKDNPTKQEEIYDLLSDWKFVSIIQFGNLLFHLKISFLVNIFKNVNAIDPISSLELEVDNHYLTQI